MKGKTYSPGIRIALLTAFLFAALSMGGCGKNGTDTSDTAASSVVSSEASAQEEIPPVTITYIPGMGEENISVTISPEEPFDAGEYLPPDRAGHEFIGWYRNEELTLPYMEGDAIYDGLMLYAYYKPDGSAFSAYQEGMAPDTEFLLYSLDQLTADTLADYVQFDDLYQSEAALCLEEVSAPTEEDAGYRYRLWAEDGFMPGGMYGFTVQKPEKVRFISAGEISLSGNKATILNFDIPKEKLDNRVLKSGVLTLTDEVSQLKEKKDNTFTALIDTSSAPAVDTVFAYAGYDGVTRYYKITEVGKASGDKVSCQLKRASGNDVWEKYQLELDMSDMTLVGNTDDLIDTEAAAKEIAQSIGFAAYVDAALDAIRESPEVEEQLAQVSQEDYDRFMNLTAVDLGFGPEELRDEAQWSQKFGDYGKVTFNATEVENQRGMDWICLSLAYDSPELELDIGKNKSSAYATVSFQISLSDTALVTAGTKEYMKDARFARMTEDYFQESVLVDNTTNVVFAASLKLKTLKKEKKEEEQQQQGDDQQDPDQEDDQKKQGDDQQSSDQQDDQKKQGDDQKSSDQGDDQKKTESDKKDTGKTEDSKKTESDKTDTGKTEDSKKTESDKTDTGKTEDSKKTESDKPDTGKTEDSKKTESDKTDTGKTDDQKKTEGDKTDTGKTDEQQKSEGDQQDSGNTGDQQKQEGNTQASGNTKDEKKDDYKFDTQLNPGDIFKEEYVKELTIAAENRDLWQYIEVMNEKLAANEELYNVDIDYVDLLRVPITTLSFTTTGVESIQIKFEFFIQMGATAKLSLKTTSHLLVDNYEANGKVTYNSDGTVKDIVCGGENDAISGTRVLQADLDILVALQGGIGIKPGLEVDVTFSAFQLNDLISTGISVEVGPYAELTGFVAYEYNLRDATKLKTIADMEGEESVTSTSSFRGGARIEIGVALGSDMFLKGGTSKLKLGLLKKNFPIYSKVLGAFDTDQSVLYGGFVDATETHQITAGPDGDTVLYLSSLAGKPVVRKERTTVSKELYYQEKLYKDESTGLYLLEGDMRTVDPVLQNNVKFKELKTGYTYAISSVTCGTKAVGTKRDLDGSVRTVARTYYDPAEIAKYATIDGDGKLTIPEGQPDMTVTVVVQAPNLEDVFTGKPPVKVFIFEYSSEFGHKADTYILSFYDTDGNLMVRDTYDKGETPLEFPGPGYTCEGGHVGSIGVAYDFGDEADVRFNAADRIAEALLKQGISGGWRDTAVDYWAYPEEVWDLDSAYWSDEPMLSGNEGNHVTANSIGAMTEDKAVYLHMKLKDELLTDGKLRANWKVYRVDPADPFKDPYEVSEGDIVKTVLYDYGRLDQVESVPDPTDEEMFGDDTIQIGDALAQEHVPYWSGYSLLDPAYGRQAAITKRIDSYEYMDNDGNYKYSTGTAYRLIYRHITTDWTYQTGKATLVVTGGPVVFADGNKEEKILCNSNQEIKVPEAMQDSTIAGWRLAGTNLVYAPDRLPVYRYDSETVRFEAVRSDIRVVFDAKGLSGMSTSFVSDNLYQVEESKRRLYFADIEKDGKRTAKITYTFTAKTADDVRLRGGVPITTDVPYVNDSKWRSTSPYDTMYWRSTEKVNGEYLILRDGDPLRVDELKLPAGSTVTFIPDSDYRNVVVTLKGSRSSFPGAGADLYAVLTGKVGEQLSAAEILKRIRRTSANEGIWFWSSKHEYFNRVLTIESKGNLPYVIGSKDKPDAVTYVDRIDVGYTAEEASVIDYDTQQFADGKKKVVTKYGDPADTVDIAAPGAQYKTTDKINYYEYVFAGWKVKGSNDVVKSFKYGKDATAVWKASGNYYSVATLVSQQGTGSVFADGSEAVNFKITQSDGAKAINALTGYQEPTGYAQGQDAYAFDSWFDGNNPGTPVTGATLAGSLGTPRNQAYLRAVYVKAFSGTTETLLCDGSDHSVSVTGLLPGISLQYSTDGTNWTATAPAFKTEGTYNVYVRGLRNGKVVTGNATTTLVLTKVVDVTVTIKGKTESVTYDGQEHSLSGYTFSASNSLYKENYFAFTGKGVTRKDAGSTALGLTEAQFTNTNKAFNVTFKVTDGKLTIDPATVTVKAKDMNKLQGSSDPTFTADVNGVVKGDSFTPSYTLSREAGENPGKYTITPSGSETQGNYKVVYKTGTLTIQTVGTITFEMDISLIKNDEKQLLFVIGPGQSLPDTTDAWTNYIDKERFSGNPRIDVSGVAEGSNLPAVQVCEYYEIQNDSGSYIGEAVRVISCPSDVVFVYGGKEYSYNEMINTPFDGKNFDVVVKRK